MSGNTARHRAALLCVGGWGLQTLLHLWPRLRFIQEERAALGLAKSLPDLTRLTAFAAVMANPIIGDSDSYQPLIVLAPDENRYPVSFYVERALQGFTNRPRGDDPTLTHAERIALQLQERAEADGYVQRLIPYGTRFGKASWQVGERLTREQMFEAALDAAEPIARALLHSVVDPTRVDAIQTQDPVVQTTLYVVGSLTEPLVGPMIWPLVAELAETLGSQYLVNVTAILAAGSFASDETRIIEEAATYTALRELAALAASDPQDSGRVVMQEQVKKYAKSGWAQRVGRRYLSRTFLLDREKSNGAYARDSLELSVLASNAIEAFLVADGAAYLDMNLAADYELYESYPYGTFGAATIYVPLAQYIDEAIREEQKRVVATALQEPASSPDVSLRSLNATPQQAVSSLLRRRVERIFVRQASQGSVLQRMARSGRQWLQRDRANTTPTDDWLPQLTVAQEYIFTRVAREQMDTAPTPWQWRLRTEASARLAMERLEPELATRGFEESWGSAYFEPADPAQGDSAIRLRQYRTQTWTQRYQNDERVIPSAVLKALEAVNQDITDRVGGILTARDRLNGWMIEIEHLLDRLQIQRSRTSQTEWNWEYERRLDRWNSRFEVAATALPATSAVVTRVLMAVLYCGLFLFGSMLLHEFPAPISLYSVSIAVAALTALTGLLMLAIVLPGQWRMRLLRGERYRLAQERLSENANGLIRSSLRTVFDALFRDLEMLHETVDEAIKELRDWADTDTPIGIPPVGVPATHLYEAYTDEEAWQTVKEKVRTERTTGGRTSEEEFHHLWKQGGNNRRNWTQNGDRLAQRVRVIQEVPLNERELETMLTTDSLVQAALAASPSPRRRPPRGGKPADAGADRTAADARLRVEEQLNQGTWCLFAESRSTDSRAARCMACQNPLSCPMSASQSVESAPLADLVREFAVKATNHLAPSNKFLPQRTTFVRQLMEQYQLEKILSGGSNGHQSDAFRASTRQVLEELYARAKPSVNYDTHFGSNGLSRQIVTLELGVTRDARTSVLARAFSERRMPLFSSYDPMAISAVRTINGLGLEDLQLVPRSAREFFRLAEFDRAFLSLVADPAQALLLYSSTTEELVEYDQIVHEALQ